MKTLVLGLLMLGVSLGSSHHTSTEGFMTQENINERDHVIEAVTALFVKTDIRDWQGVKAVLADQVLLDYTSLAGGAPAEMTPDEIVSGWQQVLPGFEHTHHAISNFQIQIEGDKATVKHYGTADHYLPNDEGGSLWVVVGTYDHQLKKVQGKWRIEQLTFNLKFIDGNNDLPRLAQEKVQQ